MNETASIILKIVISAMAIIFTRYVVPYLKSLRDDKRWQNMIDMVDVAVRAAEQTITSSGSGKEKKAQVTRFVSEWLNGEGIKVTEEELDKLIEAAVNRMNHPDSNVVVTTVINGDEVEEQFA